MKKIVAFNESGRSQPRNKGEWSKIYAICACLASGRINTRFVSTIDEDYRVSGFVIKAQTAKLFLSIEGSQVLTSRQEKDHNARRIDRVWLAEACSQLLSEVMDERPVGSFNSSTGDSILQELGIEEKFQSNGRSDLQIIVRDLLSGKDEELTVFVKSWMGASPTLLNASNSTNIRYQILAPRRELKYSVTQNPTPAELVQLIISRGYPVEFKAMNEKFQENLEAIDPALPEFIASAVFYSNSGIDRDVESVIGATIQHDPLAMGLSGMDGRFKGAFDQLLQEICAGMTATKKLRKGIDQRMGVIEVDRTGMPRLIEIVSNSKFDSYLYSNSKFDSPSRVKFKYGQLVEIDGQLFLDLNFQIRLK
jgi:hypothetical protein